MICDGCKNGDHCEGRSCQTCQHRPPGAWRGKRLSAPLGAPLTAVPPMAVRLDPDPTTPLADGDVPPFVVVLAQWHRLHKAGRFGEASVLRRALVGRLTRLGGTS